jgi:hypothetical protein
MFKQKNTFKPNQFIPKTNNEQTIKKNDTKLSYDEIRKIVEHTDEKKIQVKSQEK